MSKKFTPTKKSASDVTATEDNDPDVRMKKVSGSKYKTGAVPVDKTVGGSSGPGYNFTGITPGKTYVHPPNRLINGRVMYPCKYLGHLRVDEPRGSALVHEAIEKLLTVAEVNKTNLDEDLKEVDLSISTRSLVTVDRRSKRALHQHPLPLVSFSADDKRGNGNMFAYISRGKPPTTEHICYVYQCSQTQAREITATVGQAFELAYKKFLETKQAQQDFKRLKEMLKTASYEEKVEIEKKMIDVNKIRLEEADRKKKMASIQAKMPEPYVKPVTKINVKTKSGVGLHTGSGRDTSVSTTPMFEDGYEQAAKKVSKEVKQLEIKSEHERSKKTEAERKQSTSVEAKWENITMALEPFQMEPSLDPETQYLVKRVETKELDSAIGDIEKQIQDLEEAFDWRIRKGQGPAPTLYDCEEDQETTAILENIDGQLLLARVSAESMEVPDLPANYVMDEFVKAREKARMPKKGSVKTAAGVWYDEHHD